MAKIDDEPTGIAFLDFEASSLRAAGYPIEVGWCAAAGPVESHLIRPLPGWRDWDMTAQAVHGITRAEIEEHGRHVVWVADRLNQALANHVVVSDGPRHDTGWADLLFRTTGRRRSFRIVGFAELESRIRERWSGTATGWTAVVEEAIARASIDAPRTHRAGADAEHIRAVWRRLSEGARHDSE